MARFEAQNPKDPADTGVDYKMDWAPYIGALTIVASSWSFTGPDTVLVISDDTVFTDTSAFVEVDFGTHDRKYTVTSRVTLSNGDIRERSFELQVYNL